MKKSLLMAVYFTVLYNYAFTQTIGTFSSVQPMAQTQSLRIPSTHTFQRIIKTGDALTAGGSLGADLDFTGYIPISGSSSNGYLSISSESTPAGCAILNVNFNFATALWQTSSSGNVSFAGLGTVTRFCSGGVTPWGTVVVSEETTTTGDANSDGYDDVGWHIEIIPSTRAVKNQDGLGGNDKVWAAGRIAHENMCLMPDQVTSYYGADAGGTSYVYKYIASAAGSLVSGTLYVLSKPTLLSATGTWKVVPNGTQIQKNTTVSLSTGLAATSFNGVEDVEYGPDGKIYFTAKGPGRVYRFRDNGTVGTTTDVDQFEIYVETQNYDVDGAGPYVTEAWGLGNDNLAFDGEGNLWVLQDGGRGHLWVVNAAHTMAVPSIRLFATTPAGSEPTGITFTPDFNYLFLSFQHPSTGNTATLTDAAGISVVFNTHTTVMIARKEFLGPLAALPVIFSDFSLKLTENNGVEINWETTNEDQNDFFVIERSLDGLNFSPIERVNSKGSSGAKYQYIDHAPSGSETVYYKLRQVDTDESFSFSDIRIINVREEKIYIKSIYPNPVNDYVTVELSGILSDAGLSVFDLFGKEINCEYEFENNLVKIKTMYLNNGFYILSIRSEDVILNTRFLK